MTNTTTQEQGQDSPIEITLDDKVVTSPSRHQNGLQIRQLGPVERVDGFETQQVNDKGKKIKTIGDDDTIELHPNDHFRTVPNEGGPGGRA